MCAKCKWRVESLENHTLGRKLLKGVRIAYWKSELSLHAIILSWVRTLTSHDTEESENSPQSPHLGEIKCIHKQCVHSSIFRAHWGRSYLRNRGVSTFWGRVSAVKNFFTSKVKQVFEQSDFQGRLYVVWSFTCSACYILGRYHSRLDQFNEFLNQQKTNDRDVLNLS